MDATVALLLTLAVALVAARAGGLLAERLGQAPVLGELLAGVLLAGLGAERLGLDLAGRTPVLEALGELGVVVLLFEVGLDSKAAELLRVGARAMAVALVGVAAPVALGFGAAALLLPGMGLVGRLFLGASLAATSVGITARVFRDLGVLQRPEARLVLAAAVIDDVLGLLLLALVSGLASAGRVDAAAVGLALGKAALFVLGALLLGLLMVPRLFRLVVRARQRELTFALALALCLALAAAAEVVGLAPIVGAFAAGLMLEDLQLEPDADLSDWVLPLSSFLVPLFFVQVGARVDLGSLASGRTLLLAAVLTACAVLGKQACALAAGPGVSRLTVGLAMVPRGEVGLIFANLGAGLVVGGRPVFDAALYAAVVAMCLATTLLTPPALRLALRRAPP